MVKYVNWLNQYRIMYMSYRQKNVNIYISPRFGRATSLTMGADGDMHRVALDAQGVLAYQQQALPAMLATR